VSHPDQKHDLEGDANRQSEKHGLHDPAPTASRSGGRGYEEGVFLRRRSHAEAVPFACGGCW
jgi:hypothetical protein